VSAVEEPSFLLELLVLLRQFSFSGEAETFLLATWWEKHPGHPLTLDTRARLLLEKVKILSLGWLSMDIYPLLLYCYISVEEKVFYGIFYLLILFFASNRKIHLAWLVKIKNYLFFTSTNRNCLFSVCNAFATYPTYSIHSVRMYDKCLSSFCYGLLGTVRTFYKFERKTS
jgi:hypothetical protein